MTQEEKELLLKNLLARLPYHIKVAINYEIYLNILPDEKFKERFLFLLEYDKKTIEEKSLEPHIICSYPCRNRFMTFTGCHNEYGVPIEAIKPYLRPMSSMTKEERNEYHSYCEYYYGTYFDTVESIDWLNKKMFDYRKDNEGKTMIEKGLALEAPEGMYTDDKFVLITKEELEKTRISSKDYLI